jgi:hypothetical protein
MLISHRFSPVPKPRNAPRENGKHLAAILDLVVVHRVTRWDPSSRAGAVAFRAKSRYDVSDVHEAVAEWARYQNLAGDLDNAEPSPVAATGPYGWKAYLHEEAKLAEKRGKRNAKPAAAKPEPEPAPSVFYA